MTRLLDLDDLRTRDPQTAGSKAAWLAHARGAGLPVLPGFVVPIAEAASAFQRGRESLAEGGSGAARLAVMDVDLDGEFADELLRRGRELSPQLVVRSSSPLESEGVWSGAFTSYHEITPEELPTAVRGCWSSAFSSDVLERREATGLATERLSLAVLIQPQLEMEAGGTAGIGDGGAVTVVAVAGSPQAMLAGWEVGLRAVVDVDGRIEGETAVSTLGEAAIRGAAELARAAQAQFGDCLIEWGSEGERIVLLQVQPSAAAPDETPGSALPPELSGPTALRVAGHVLRFAGPLGETLVLPWMLALPGAPAPVAPSGRQSGDDALASARALAEEMTRAAWQAPLEEAAERASAALAALRGADPGEALERVERLHGADPVSAGEALGLLHYVAEQLVARGLLPEPEAIWRYTFTQVESMLAGVKVAPPRPGRASPERWDLFLHATASLQGRQYEGVAASAGVGAGPLRLIGDAADGARCRPGDVIVAPHPLAWLAPLLWNAAGLVTMGGSPAAHLLEVARWVRVPAVVGCELGDAVSWERATEHQT
ncbi:MAG: PEP/pyruvate-binding domain-containing protein, partial [Dehalococcoidia bacterium]